MVRLDTNSSSLINSVKSAGNIYSVLLFQWIFLGESMVHFHQINFVGKSAELF